MRCRPDGARKYFDRIPDRWDSLYGGKSLLSRLADRLLRKALFERRSLTYSLCGDVEGARVLDIGCGTGQYSLEFAARGAAEVIGIDFAPAMVEFSKHKASKAGFGGTCRFVSADFLEYQFTGTFDIVLALGFFDYIDAAGPVLEKIAGLTAGRFLASFPRYLPLWSLQRKVRYRWIRRCPIHDYSREQLEVLFARAGFAQRHIIPIQRGFFVVAQTDRP